jgi:uncharacterized protein YeaC (DUF1315 family)
MNIRFIKLAGIFFLLIVGCSEIEVDTFQKWCELISGDGLKDKYSKYWVIKLSVSIDEDSIREDFISFLNRSLLKKIQYKVPQMAWRDDKELHIINLSSLQNLKPEITIEKWKHGLKLAMQQKHTDFVDICIYETVTRLFDNLYIHTMKFDNEGKVIEEIVTPIQPY